MKVLFLFLNKSFKYIYYKLILPISKLIEQFWTIKIQLFYKNRKTLERLKGKKCIECLFIVSDIADWKCDSVFTLMLKNERFNPRVLIAPAVNYNSELLIYKQKQCVDFFSSKQYSFIVAFNAEEKKYINVKKELNPDIIFYTIPYKAVSDKRYYISNLRDSLGVYIPYAFSNNCNLNYQYDLLFHNLVWRYYVESEEHLSYFKQVSRCKGISGVVTGYPAIENLIRAHEKRSYESWKIDNRSLKRIIWAPHHTIERKGIVVYSCFLEYAHFMVQMAQKYQNEIQIAFKPHPLLRPKLNELWGKEKTDTYYKCWEEMPNTSLCEGDYVDLFLTSDAMIHDSGSFITEYLYVNKPVMRTINDIPLSSMYNSFTLKSLDQYYLARNTKDVEQFIENIIKGIDPLKEQRTSFINEVLMPQKSPSQSIIENILDSIDNQILYCN